MDAGESGRASRSRSAGEAARPEFTYACDGPVDRVEELAKLGFTAVAAPNLDLDDRAARAIRKAGLKLIPDLSLATSTSPHPPRDLAVRTVALVSRNKLLDHVAWWLVGRGLRAEHLDDATEAARGFVLTDPSGVRPTVVG